MELSFYVTGLVLMLTVVCGQYVPIRNGTYPPLNNYGKRCGLPIVVQTSPNPQPERIRGTWYKYRQSGIPVSVNEYLVHYPLGRTGLPFSTVQAEAVWFQVSKYGKVNNTHCTARFWTGLYGLDGTNPGQVAYLGKGFVPVRGDSYGMYFDYDNVVMTYTCRKLNYVSGMCDHPMIHIMTRQRPDKMPAAQMEYLDNLIDQIFAPFCIKAQDIPRQLFTDERPFCPMIPLPECVQKTITGLSIDVENSVTG